MFLSKSDPEKKLFFGPSLVESFPLDFRAKKNFLGLNPTNSLLACIYKLVNGNLFKCSLTQFVHACLLNSFVFKSEDKSERVEFDYTCNYKLLYNHLYSRACKSNLVNRLLD